MAHTQDGRHISITTPLGKDVLLLKGLSGNESVSQLFSYELDLLSEVNPAIDFNAIVGKNVTVAIKHAAGTRHINGIVRRFSQGAGDPSFATYRAEIVPWLWFLTQTADCRIFQNMTVPDILKKIFTDLGFTDFKMNLGAFPPREFCVQYRETDFNFVSRLMEQYGVFYYFEHAAGKHTLVLANAPSAYPAIGGDAIRYQAATGAPVTPKDVVTAFTKEQEIRPGKYSMSDYNFETPSVKLGVSVDSVHPPSGGTLEIYDYPGEYLKRNDGEALVKLRIEEEELRREVAFGAGSVGQFTAGYKFRLTNHARRDLNAEYLLSAVTHAAAEHGYESGDDNDFSYSNTFSCIPAAVPFRPPRLTAKPVIQGSQTAEVVGPRGEEIWTDNYGRVKLQFHWDREGKRDEKSSCWIRVSHPWAGKQWGAIQIPRIGQEVIVDFLEGDPDQPIVTGRVYNGEQMPPYTLPAGGVISGVKSNSTKGGGGYNEISLDDTKGKERITVHGQYDMNTVVEHDVTKDVGHDESVHIGHDRTETVDHDESISIGNNRTENVEKDETISIGNNRSETVGKNESIDIGENRSESVGKKEDVTIGDNRSHKIGKDDLLDVAKNLVITAGDSITIKTGSASLTMKKNGDIQLKGANVKVEGSGKIQITASGDVNIKGSKVTNN